MLDVKVTVNENVKIVFPAYLRENWTDLRQTKTKVIGVHCASSNTSH